MESYNLVNANIITLSASLQTANTITISNGKIENINQPNSLYKTLDLNGHTVIPGFIDAHFHLKNFGKRLEMLNLKGIKSLDEIFKVESYESNSALGPGIILKTPLYEDRMVLYTNYMEGSDVKYDISDYWTNRNINFDNNNNKPTWKLMDYYEYFKKSILNKDNIERKGYSTFYISKYRKLQKQIKDIMKICSNKGSFLIVLESIRDIKVSNLMGKIDKGKLIY